MKRNTDFPFWLCRQDFNQAAGEAKQGIKPKAFQREAFNLIEVDNWATAVKTWPPLRHRRRMGHGSIGKKNMRIKLHSTTSTTCESFYGRQELSVRWGALCKIGIPRHTASGGSLVKDMTTQWRLEPQLVTSGDQMGGKTSDSVDGIGDSIRWNRCRVLGRPMRWYQQVGTHRKSILEDADPSFRELLRSVRRFSSSQTLLSLFSLLLLLFICLLQLSLLFSLARTSRDRPCFLYQTSRESSYWPIERYRRFMR